MTEAVRRAVAAHALAALGMSVVWPSLILLAWEATGSDLAVGVTAAARMLPYVVLSAYAGRLADRFDRTRVVRWSLWIRLVLLLICAALLSAGDGWLATTPAATVAATVAATLAVGAGTAAYPALAAAMPALAGPASSRATSLLVTVEVSSFVVGPALGGLATGRVDPAAVALSGALMLAAARLVLGAVRLPTTARTDLPALTIREIVRQDRRAFAALSVIVGGNGLIAALALALLPLAEQVWAVGGAGFGLATAVLGFAALGAPLVAAVPGLRRLTPALVAYAGCLAGVGLAPWPMVLVPVAAVGALAVRTETAATWTLQAVVPDHVRASVLGLADAAMIAAALVASLITPALSAFLGPVLLTLALALAAAAVLVPAGNQASAREVVMNL